MDRNEALTLLTSHVPDKHLVSHCIATSAVMKALAPHFSADPDEWELAGILHDIDYCEVGGDMQRHGLVGYDILISRGVPEQVARIIREHNHFLFGGNYKQPVEIALQAADSVSGLITACALVKQGKLSEVSPSTVKKKFKEKSFAAGCDRDRIRLIEPLIGLDEFYGIAIAGLMTVREELGLT
ncbi:MAG: HDIG domain-containing metalloprotein [Methanoregulaceae archaeon]